MAGIKTRVSRAESTAFAKSRYEDTERARLERITRDEELEKLILGEVTAGLGGESVNRIHSARTDLDPEMARRLFNLADAVGMPHEQMLPGMAAQV